MAWPFLHRPPAIPGAPPASILVFRGGALGDLVLTFPVLAALRAAFPGARVAVAAQPQFKGLLLEHGELDEFVSLEDRGLASLFDREAPADAGWTARLSACDLAVSFLADPADCFHRRLRELVKGPVLRGPARPDESVPRGAAAQLLTPLAEIGLGDPPARPRLSRPPDVPVSRRLALHPGSGSPAKNWPEPSWAAWIRDHVRPAGWEVLLIGGEAEEGRAARLARLLPPDRVRLAEGLTLPALVRELRTCAGFVGHDSGVAHLAAAAGLPGLVLWGATNARVWMPGGPDWSRLEAAGGLPVLPVSRVAGEVAVRREEWCERAGGAAPAGATVSPVGAGPAR